ncbi:MAG: BrnA antitoxin family protein [Rhodobacteraceae bacterium]|nr:BrnA antitoxin family protein [Paracoccaceae bacterium]
MTRQTKSEKDRLAAYHDLAQTMRGLEEDLRWGLNDTLRIPREWREIATQPVLPKKRLVTIRLDEDVLAFFRAMGAGYLTRMNAVLRTFMLARLAGVVTGPEGVRYEPTVEEEMKSVRRQILDAALAEEEARDARGNPMQDAEARKARLETLKQLRDARKGRRPGG